MKTFYQIFSIQDRYSTIRIYNKAFCYNNKTYGMTFLANTMASRIFSTEEVVLFSFFSWKTEIDNPYEPLVECSNEKFEYLEEQNNSSR